MIGHLVLVPAIADAGQETAARDLVDRGDLLGGLDRVALRDQAEMPVPSSSVLVTAEASPSTT